MRPHGAAVARDAHPIAGPIAHERRAEPPEVGQDQLARGRKPAGGRIDHLGDELALVDVEPGLGAALVAVRAHLGHARVVVGPRAPRRLQARAHRRDPRAGLPSVHGGADPRLREVDAALARQLGQVEGVRGRTAHRGGAERLDGGEALRRVLPAPGNRQAPERARSLEACPEPDEEPEREREEHAVLWSEAGTAQDEAPAARPPVPRLLRIEPAQRRAGRAGGLVDPHVALERKRQVGSEGRMRGLVGDELILDGEWQPREVVPSAEVGGRVEPSAPPLLREEPVGGMRGARQRLQPGPLTLPGRLGALGLQAPIVERRHQRSLNRWIFPVAVLGRSDTNSTQRGYL